MDYIEQQARDIISNDVTSLSFFSLYFVPLFLMDVVKAEEQRPEIRCSNFSLASITREIHTSKS